MPWVADVSIRCVWPDTVKIVIVERQPVAIWNRDRLVASDGVLFRSNSKELSQLVHSLPLLTGSEGTHANVFSAYTALEEVLKTFPLSVVKLDCDVNGLWQMKVRS